MCLWCIKTHYYQSGKSLYYWVFLISIIACCGSSGELLSLCCGLQPGSYLTPLDYLSACIISLCKLPLTWTALCQTQISWTGTVHAKPCPDYRSLRSQQDGRGIRSPSQLKCALLKCPWARKWLFPLKWWNSVSETVLWSRWRPAEGYMPPSGFNGAALNNLFTVFTCQNSPWHPLTTVDIKVIISIISAFTVQKTTRQQCSNTQRNT